MSDHSELRHYKFDEVDQFLRCTYTGGERPCNVDSVMYVQSDRDSKWYNTKTWERIMPCPFSIELEKALLQHRYNEAIERSEQSDHPPLSMPTQLSDSVQEVIRHVVIASNVETYKKMTDSIDKISQQTIEAFDESTTQNNKLTENVANKLEDMQGVVDLIKEKSFDLLKRTVALEKLGRDLDKEGDDLVRRLNVIETLGRRLQRDTEDLKGGDETCQKE